MSKKLIDRFSEIYEANLSNNFSRMQTFTLANEQFLKECGFSAYSSYQSFKARRWQERKNRRK